MSRWQTEFFVQSIFAFQKELSDPDLSANKSEPSVVDVRDTSSARLHQMLGQLNT